MSMFRYTIILILMLLPATILAQEAERKPASGSIVLTLERAISLALDQNRDVLIADKERDVREEEVREARSGAFPLITINGQYTRNINKQVLFLGPNTPLNPTNATQSFKLGSNNAYSAGASLKQALYDRKVGVALDIANTYREYSDEAYRGTQHDVTLAVKRAFYQILLAKKLVEANRQGLDVVKANLENVKSQYRHGSAAEYDLLRAEVQLANTEPVLISAENSLQLATNNLRYLLSLPLDTPLEVQGEFAYEDISNATLEKATKEALSTNSMILQLAMQESILEKNISVERAGYFPTLNLVSAYNFQTEDNTFKFKDYKWANTFNVGLQLSFPLFNGFKTSARTEQAIINHDIMRVSRSKAEEGLNVQIQAAELRMVEATKRIKGQEKNIEQAEKAVRIAQTRF